MTEVTPEFITREDTSGRAITAAAQILHGPRIQRRAKKPTGKGMPWQIATWEYYDEIGEYSWAVELLATHVSKVKLVAARDIAGVDEPVLLDGEEYEVNGETQQPSKIELDAAALIASFAGGTTGQQQVMYRAAVQQIVAAESYIVGRQDEEGEPVWEAYSNQEIRAANGEWMIDDGTEKYTLSENDILIRVWRPHPRWRGEPRSSSKPLIPILAEIKGLTQAIGARIDSRLAGAGILLLPESVALLSGGGAKLEEGENPLVAELVDAMLTPIRDRDSAAAVVPIIMTIPDESAAKVQHIRFEVTAKAEEAAARLDAIGRMATAVDLPREQVTGMGNMNHWGAWQADEATVKGPVATLASILVHALTVGYLRPGLLELGHDPAEVRDFLCWFDLTDLIQRPDRSEQAMQVFDRGGIGYAALLRESGLDAADQPTEEDTCRQLLLSLVKTDPANAGQYLVALGPCAGITLPPGAFPPAPIADTSTTVEQIPVVDAPANNRNLPQLAAAVVEIDHSGCLYSTCEVAVLRALELAGKRMRGSAPRNIRSGLLAVPQYELHCNDLVSAASAHSLDALLEDAWTPLRFALPDRPELVADLDDYVRGLIEARLPHDPNALRLIAAVHA